MKQRWVTLSLAFLLLGAACSGDESDDGSSLVPAVCGDGDLNPDEVCDGERLRGVSCDDFGYSGGFVACGAGCDRFDVSGCTPVCNNGVVEQGELCDGDEVRGATCGSLGLSGEDLNCNGTCDGFDLNSCESARAPMCGNDIREQDEVCDGSDLAGLDCTDFGFTATGGLECAPGCGAFDFTACGAQCDGVAIEPGEICDGTIFTAGFSGSDCSELGEGYHPNGSYTCNSNCEGFDTINCQTCSDGVTNGSETGVDCGGELCPACALGSACENDSDCTSGSCDLGVSGHCVSVCDGATLEAGEVCDGANLNGLDCTDFGFSGGLLACNGSCDGYDLSSCSTTCNNGSRERDEVCDGNDLAGLDCTAFGFTNPSGLACESSCASFDTTGCAPECDGAALEPGELCDATNLAGGLSGSNCSELGDAYHPGGSYSCTLDCRGFDTSNCRACNDGATNGTESDVDCGGGICAGCALGQACNFNSDCLSGTCDIGVSDTCI
ncbi:MAG: hypothetical protein AAF654_15170 [Myxococcota bacterium]